MNKLEQLHRLRERCGIVFRKSFRCKEAEKNIHLLDIDTFFAKFKQKLKLLGYTTSDDFEFDIIRHKYNYAERHHIGKSYNWKYFYSSTFTISDELIEYLLRHRFIFVKNQTIVKSKIKSTTNKNRKIEERDYVLNLLKEGKTKSEIIKDLREQYESFQCEIKENEETLKVAESSEQKEALQNIIKNLKKESRWCKQCIFEIRVKMVEPSMDTFGSKPYNKMVLPIMEGKSYTEVLDYLNQRIEYYNSDITKIKLMLKDKRVQKDKDLMKRYNGEQNNKQKNVEELKVCVADLKSGKFDYIFNK